MEKETHLSKKLKYPSLSSLYHDEAEKLHNERVENENKDLKKIVASGAKLPQTWEQKCIELYENLAEKLRKL